MVRIVLGRAGAVLLAWCVTQGVAAATVVALEPAGVAASAPGASPEARLRFDQAAIRQAVGEGALRAALLRLPVAHPPRAVAPLERFEALGPARPGRESVAPDRSGSTDIDVTRDVRDFLDGRAPNYGWRIAPAGGAETAWVAGARLVLDVEPAAAPRGVLRVADDRWNFAWSLTGEIFVPRGVNYFGPFGDGQIEEAWDERWDLIEQDLARIAADDLNAVRVHLQFGYFMPEPFAVDERQLIKLDQLVGLARRHGLLLNVTGLSHYRAAAIPAWYRALDDETMFAAEAAFWTAIARRYPRESTIFCWDIQNEPLVSFQDRPGQVVGPSIDDERWHYTNFHFLGVSRYWRAWLAEQPGFWRRAQLGWRQHPLIAALRGPAPLPGKPEAIAFAHQLARWWTARMVWAIRAHDAGHLVTVGLVPWSLPFRTELYAGFSPLAVRDLVDFIAVHVYPGHPDATLDDVKLTVRAAWVGLPVVLEETMPYLGGEEENLAYYRWTLTSASGWFGFFLPPRWHHPTPRDLALDRVRAQQYRAFLRFVNHEVPRDGVQRRPGDQRIEVSVAELRAARTGAALRARLLDRQRALAAAGQTLDVVLLE